MLQWEHGNSEHYILSVNVKWNGIQYIFENILLKDLLFVWD